MEYSSQTQYEQETRASEQQVTATTVAAISTPKKGRKTVEAIKAFSEFTGQLERDMLHTPEKLIDPKIREVVHEVVLRELTPATHANMWLVVDPTEMMELVQALTKAAMEFQQQLALNPAKTPEEFTHRLHQFTQHLHHHPAVKEFRADNEHEPSSHISGGSAKHTGIVGHIAHYMRHLFDH